MSQHDLEERTALCLAVMDCNSNMVQLLLSAKAPTGTTPRFGEVPGQGPSGDVPSTLSTGLARGKAFASAPVDEAHGRVRIVCITYQLFNRGWFMNMDLSH